MHAALVGAAVLQQALKLRTVRRLRALTFLLEALEDLVALATAIFLARAELRRQAQVFCLLFGADADR
jgi:hypothetical protein